MKTRLPYNFTPPPSLHTSKKKEIKKKQGGIIYFERRHVLVHIQTYTWEGKLGEQLDRLTRDTYKMEMQDIGRNNDMSVKTCAGDGR